MLRVYQATVLLVQVAAAAQAQTPPVIEQPLLGSTLTAEVLRDLPTGGSVFAVPETIQLETVSDLFSAGGLNVAGAPKVGGLLNSWTQTQYRVGDVTITDPRAGGTPLLLPFLPLWSRVTIATGAMGVEDNASVSIGLEPPRPGATWTRAFEGTLSGSALVSQGTGAVPAVDRVSQWQDASVMVSGPVTSRLGLVAAGSFRGLSHVAAPSVTATDDRVASGFAHLVFAAGARDEFRALGWAQQATTAARSDTALHVQATWERRDPANLSWRVFGGYTGRNRTTPATPLLVVDSLDSDPVSDLIDTGAGAARRWVAGARLAPPKTRMLPSAGVDVEGAEVRVDPTATTQINELVNRGLARIWTYHLASGPDVRQLTTVAAFANEHIASGRLTLDAGLRLDTVNGTANGATRGVNWTTLLPSAKLAVHIFDTADVAAVASYRRTAYQLPLNVLAIGDPSAPFADVSRPTALSNTLIARVGPGTGGDASFTQIDPALERPTTDELVLALRARPRKGLELQLARVVKRETSLLNYVDTGVLASEYSSSQIADPSFLPGSPVGAPQVTVFNRPAGSYGRDRYVLTNRTGDSATSWALEATVRMTTDKLMLLVGLGLTEANGPAGAVGFLATENDQDIVGNMLVDPNAQTNIRGQLFQDRSHIGKIAAAYHFPSRVTVGAIFRYADGQPFTRLVVAPFALNQGAVPIRSYANGGSAFTFVGTIDLRVQKAFTVGRAEVAAIADVYNLPNLDNEVVEHVVSGPSFRTPTALQPPRTALVGLRVSF